MPNKHKINVFDDLWPQRGEKLKYIWDSVEAYNDYESSATLTCGYYYEVIDVKWIPCKDQVRIVDDLGQRQWIDLIKFNYRDDI